MTVKPTPTPWGWLIHDHSMASLGVLPDPGLGDPLVLAVSPCQSCIDRAEHPKEWKWGRCHTPSQADAEFILLSVNSHDALVKLLEKVAPFLSYGDGAEGRLKERIRDLLASIKEPTP